MDPSLNKPQPTHSFLLILSVYNSTLCCLLPWVSAFSLLPLWKKDLWLAQHIWWHGQWWGKQGKTSVLSKVRKDSWKYSGITITSVMYCQSCLNSLCQSTAVTLRIVLLERCQIPQDMAWLYKYKIYSLGKQKYLHLMAVTESAETPHQKKPTK